MKKPTLTGADFMRIIDAAHDKFIKSKNLPQDSKQLQAYLILHGLKSHMSYLKLELPFEVLELDVERGEIGGLDEIG